MTPSPASATPAALGITEHATAKQQPVSRVTERETETLNG